MCIVIRIIFVREGIACKHSGILRGLTTIGPKRGVETLLSPSVVSEEGVSDGVADLETILNRGYAFVKDLLQIDF